MWVPCLPRWVDFWCRAYDMMVARGAPITVASREAGKMLAHATRKQLDKPMCPKCRGTNLTETTVGHLDGVNRNKVKCGCGWQGDMTELKNL